MARRYGEIGLGDWVERRNDPVFVGQVRRIIPGAGSHLGVWQSLTVVRTTDPRAINGHVVIATDDLRRLPA